MPRLWLFEETIDTDVLAPGFYMKSPLDELAEHCLEAVRPEFVSKVQKGDVILAEPGVKGTTNTHPCLLEPAKKTAQLHKWFPDTEAPEIQIGFVVIQFKLGE